MDLCWGQYGVLWIWGKTIVWGEVEIHIICQMFMVQAHWFMDTYISRKYSYYHSLFYIHKVAPEWHFFQTIVQYDVTIVQYDVTIVTPWWQSILENIDWSIHTTTRGPSLLWQDFLLTQRHVTIRFSSCELAKWHYMMSAKGLWTPCGSLGQYSILSM